MDWTQQIDAYCERLGPSYWAEPVNAVTNLAFLIAAVWMWRRVSSDGPPEARLLSIILGAIGVGSYLFHTHATAWSAMADVLPILIYILVYIYAANRHYWRLGPLWSFGAMLLFFPYAAALVPLFQMVPFYGASAEYLPVPLLIAIYAILLRHRAPETARGMGWGVGILMVSLTFRSLDAPLCEAVPMGTHFMWHILNGIMLGWMIELLRRHHIHHQTS